MNQVFNAAIEVSAFCRQQGWKHCIIGGVALQRWGEPRQTIDVDLTLLTGFGGEELYVDAMLSRFEPRRPDAREWALLHRVLLVRASGIGVDVALGALPFEENTIRRSSAFTLSNGVSIPTCSAEDLIVHKAFANRLQDWADIENVLVKQHGNLKFDVILRELKPLVAIKEQPEILTQLERSRREVEKRVARLKPQSPS